MSKKPDRGELDAIWDKLGPNAAILLMDQARGFERGLPQGDFDTPHRWDSEASEEARDALNYLTVEIRQIRQAMNAASKANNAKELDRLASRLAKVKEARAAFRLAQRLLLQVRQGEQQPSGGE